MSIGTANLTVAIRKSTRALITTGTVHHRNLVAVTVKGFTGAASNLLMLVFRRGTAVAQCGAFSGSGTLTGSLDMDTEAMATAMSGVDNGDIRTFDVRMWDTSTLALVATGTMDVRQTAYSTGTDTGATGVVVVTPAGWYFETVDGINYFVARDSNGVVYQRIPAPGATPNE